MSDATATQAPADEAAEAVAVEGPKQPTAHESNAVTNYFRLLADDPADPPKLVGGAQVSKADKLREKANDTTKTREQRMKARLDLRKLQAETIPATLTPESIKAKFIESAKVYAAYYGMDSDAFRLEGVTDEEVLKAALDDLYEAPAE